MEPQQSTEKRKRRKWILGLTGGYLLLSLIPALFLLGFFGVYYNLGIKWPEPREGVRLEPQQAPLDQLNATNGFYHLHDLVEQMRADRSKGLRARKDWHARAPFSEGDAGYERWREQHPELQELYDQATDLPYWQDLAEHPRPPTITETMSKDERAREELYFFHMHLEVNAAQLFRLSQAVHDGRWADVEDLFRRQLKHAVYLDRGQSGLHQEFSHGASERALNALNEMLYFKDPPIATLDRLDQILTQMEQDIIPYAESLRHRRSRTLAVIPDVYAGKKVEHMDFSEFAEKTQRPFTKKLYRSTPSHTSNNVDRVFASLIADAQVPYGTETEMDRWHIKMKEQTVRRILPTDAMGRFLVQGMTMGTTQQRNATYLHRTRFQAARTVIGIARYVREFKQLPESLEALVPTYLARVPMDPATNDTEPLIYRRDKGWFYLYGRGANRQDDGGWRDEVDWGDGPELMDWVFFPTPDLERDKKSKANTETP